MKRLDAGNRGIDDVDAAILTALGGNARVTTSDLARAIGLSAPSTAERVKRLEEAGIILGFHAGIDPSAIGFGLARHVRGCSDPCPPQKPAAVSSAAGSVIAV